MCKFFFFFLRSLSLTPSPVTSKRGVRWRAWTRKRFRREEGDFPCALSESGPYLYGRSVRTCYTPKMTNEFRIEIPKLTWNTAFAAQPTRRFLSGAKISFSTRVNIFQYFERQLHERMYENSSHILEKRVLINIFIWRHRYELFYDNISKKVIIQY